MVIEHSGCNGCWYIKAKVVKVENDVANMIAQCTSLPGVALLPSQSNCSNWKFTTKLIGLRESREDVMVTKVSKTLLPPEIWDLLSENTKHVSDDYILTR